MLCLFLGMSMSVADELIVSGITIPQGGKATLSVSLTNSGSYLQLFEFVLTLPEGVTPVAGSQQLSDRFGSKSSLDVNSLGESRYKFVCAPSGTDKTPIAGNEGVLMTVDLQASAPLAEGDVVSAALSAIEVTTVASTPWNPADITFDIIIGEARVVLDENSTSVPEAAEGVNVRVYRTIKANQWSTICLPFAMTEAQVKAAFGDDVQLGDFAGYETETDDDKNIVGIKVNFEDATAIEANHPYIIKVTDNISEFTADNVDIAPEDEPTVAAVRRTKKQWSEMIGSYVPTTIDNQMLFLSGNHFWYSVGATKMKGYRAYFDFYDVLTEVEDAYGSRIALHFANGETSSLSVIKSGSKLQECVYNLNGQRVFQPAKGLYIVDGKKVIIN